MLNNKSKATELILSESKGFLREYLKIVDKEQLLKEKEYVEWKEKGGNVQL